MSVSISWDGVDLSTVGDFVVRNVVRPIMPTPRDVRLDVPGRAGSWLYVEEPGDREVAVDLAYVGSDSDDRRTKLREFAAWLYSTSSGRLIFGDEPDRYWLGRISEAPTAREILSLGEFSVRFLVAPFALSTVVSTINATQGGTPGAFGPATFTGGGDVDAPPLIEVRAGSSGMSGGFELDVNGTVLVYGLTVAPLETISVNAVSGIVSAGAGLDTELTGAVDPVLVAMRDVSGDFGEIVPGDNSITVTPADASTGASVSLNYRRRFLG